MVQDGLVSGWLEVVRQEDGWGLWVQEGAVAAVGKETAEGAAQDLPAWDCLQPEFRLEWEHWSNLHNFILLININYNLKANAKTQSNSVPLLAQKQFTAQ